MARKTPELNLNPETREVVAQDLNLFYRPEAEPLPSGVEEFTRALDSFVNNAGTKLALAGEIKEKKVNEAQAIKEYNENRGKFNDLVKSGKLPKEANPYFIDKFKGLELNDQARLFKSHLYSQYAKKRVELDTSEDGFQNFYAKTIQNYVKDNQLGHYEVSMLNKEFFTKTDGIRNELNSRHVNTQLAKVGAEYKKKAINGIQGFFEDDGDPDFFINSGANITAYIKDMTKNGLSNQTAQEYLLEAIEGYVKNTDDIDGASKLIAELPKHIKLGTDSFANVKGLKDEFNALEDALLDREVEIEDRILKQNNVQESKDKRFIRETVDSSDFDFIEFKKTDEYKDLSQDNKALVETYYSKGQTAFAIKDNIEVKNKIIGFLKDGNYDDAEQYLLDVGSTQLREVTFNEMRNNITYYEATGTNGELDNYAYKYFIKDVADRVTLINKGGNIIPPDISQKFESSARRWLEENKDKYIGSNLEEAFEDWARNKYKNTLLVLAGEKPKEVADMSLVKTDTNSTETTTTKKTEVFQPIDIKDYAIIPKGLSRGQLQKFKRDNENAITQENFDKLVKAQEAKNNPTKRKGTR
jgi:hypothetical protein